MKFKIRFMDRDLADLTVETESPEALMAMYLGGQLDGDTINHGTNDDPEAIQVTAITEGPSDDDAMLKAR